jgi:hypothetical protein
MTERTPHSHATHLINETRQSLLTVTTLPDGRPRDLNGPTAVGALTVQSNLAIASALLAIADAVKANGGA